VAHENGFDAITRPKLEEELARLRVARMRRMSATG